jgi:hypothetical protein
MPTPTLDQRTPNIRLKYESDDTRNYNWEKLDDLLGLLIREQAMAEQAYAKVTFSANQTVAHLTDHPVIWNTAIVNTGGMWNPSEPDRFTIQTSGFYVVSGNIVWDGVTGGIERDLGISLNDPHSWDLAGVSVPPPSASLGYWGQSISTGVRLEPGDRIYMILWQDSGAPRFIHAAFSSFSIVRVGGVE